MALDFKRYVNSLFIDITALGGISSTAIILLMVWFLIDAALFMQLLLGILVTISIVIIIRLIYFRDRPKKQVHSNIIERIEASSFPSLHAARSSFMALVFITYFDILVLNIIIVIIALLISYSRVYLKKHYWSDIFAGWLLGGIIYYYSISSFFIITTLY